MVGLTTFCTFVEKLFKASSAKATEDEFIIEILLLLQDVFPAEIYGIYKAVSEGYRFWEVCPEWREDAAEHFQRKREVCNKGKVHNLDSEHINNKDVKFIEIESPKKWLLKIMPAGDTKNLEYRHNTSIEESIESFAKVIHLSRVLREDQTALRERVKELTCIYKLSRISQMPLLSLEEILEKAVGTFPEAFQFPESTIAEILFDEKSFVSPRNNNRNNKEEKGHSDLHIYSYLYVYGVKRGKIIISYEKQKLPDYIQDFLPEEKSLVESVVKQLGLMIESKLAENERVKLEEQLRHADRLATIGELAAGVAHELNEPLGSILGFSQLLRKDPDMKDNTVKDLGRIEAASLHAREIVKKLLFFARQVPARKEEVSLNNIVDSGLYFLRSRCEKEGIQLLTTYDEELSSTFADASQIHQVLVNLVVNSIQAIVEENSDTYHKEGRIEITTKEEREAVVLTVSDNGPGITEEVKKQIFVPFFSTKEVGRGTGLGLAVVHGIVKEHQGTIDVQSERGEGATFSIFLPKIRE